MTVNTSLTAAKLYGTTSSTLKSSGIDTTEVDNMMSIFESASSGSASGVASGMCSAMGCDEVTTAIISGIADIVQAVLLSGHQAAQPDVEAVAEDKGAMTNQADTMNRTSNDSQARAQEVQQNAKGTGEALGAEVEGAKTTIEMTEEEAKAQLEGLQEYNDELQASIEENNEKIEQEKQEQERLLSQINQKKAELKLEADLNPKQAEPQEGEDGEGQTSASPQISTEGIPDGELKDLINQYNASSTRIDSYTSQNTTWTNTIAENTESMTEISTAATQTTAEQSQKIDECATEIVNAAATAQSAISETQALLKGDFKQIDKVMGIQLATAATKAAINGSKSGLLTAAASALGVGAIFSFGASSEKAVECGLASGMEAGAAAGQIANQVAGKVLQSVYTSYMNKIWSEIGNEIGVDISTYMNQIQQAASEASMTAQNSEFYTTPDEDNKKEEPKKTSA